MSAVIRRLVVAAVVSACLAGCRGMPSPTSASASTRTSGRSGEFVDATAYRAALLKTYAAFHWPADYRPDLDALAAQSGPPPGARISAGGEQTVLEIVNRCAWYLSWDAARRRHDSAAAAGALAVMTDVLPTYGAADPDGQQLARDTAQRAGLGDPALARQYVRANCDTTKFLAS